MRLDKYISDATDFSRKEARRLLREGVISIDGLTVDDPSRHVKPGEVVRLEGTTLAQPGPRYFMLNKPVGYICATRDGKQPIVLDLLDEPNSDRLQIAGRLDIDTTGLVLITDDGRWNHAVTSPNSQCPKTYHLQTADPIAANATEKFARGIMLEGERHRTKPALLELVAEREARLTISEGRYHQVKRMFAALGNRVVKLHRESVGAIVLDSRLAPGEYRPLTTAEVDSVHTSNRRGD